MNIVCIGRILDDCESTEKLGSDIIQSALNDCMTVNEDLVLQWNEIMQLRQQLHTLPVRLRASVSPIAVEREISRLQVYIKTYSQNNKLEVNADFINHELIFFRIHITH